MATTKIKTGSALSQLGLTPLIDIVFLLLIFFLVATRFAEEEREMDVLLPEASEAQPLTSKPRELFINIDHEGRYYVTGKIVTLDELQPILNAAYVNSPGRASVVIRADRRCRWDYVVSAMNACNRAKIRDYRVTTKEGPSG
ncbi:MAG: biopolymer transporter ExbD [Thermoguttaceae bacterium]|jgi:biopolymer transport protein ExbD|nr:biopolymer transporter ExbD [Thermoguttaceae bacterium]